MPQGNPKPQTKATDKYQKKVGYMVKGFKLKRELVEQYGCTTFRNQQVVHQSY